MKIVDYETFIRMPADTIFAEYTPCAWKSEWEIKMMIRAFEWALDGCKTEWED